eukprot:sb/3476336/
MSRPNPNPNPSPSPNPTFTLTLKTVCQHSRNTQILTLAVEMEGTARGFIQVRMSILQPKCSPDNFLQHCFWLSRFNLLFDELWAFEWNPPITQNHRSRKDSGTSCTIKTMSIRKVIKI